MRKRKTGRPKMMRRKTFEQDLARVNEEVVDIAMNRLQWRKVLPHPMCRNA